MKNINKVSIIGMGALGLMYADIVQKHLGSTAVQFVMDEKRLLRNKNTEYKINGIPVKFNMVLPENAGNADFILVAVKFNALNDAVEMMKKITGPETVIISVLNGIVSEEILASHFGKEKIVYSVAQGMDSMKFGSDVHFTKEGELRIGVANGGLEENLRAVESFFDRSGIKYTEEKDIICRMWNKFMLNVGINQTCMAYGACYSKVLNTKELKDVFTGAMREVKLIAEKKGINLTENDIEKWIDIISTFAPDGTPSMGQDRIARRKSEVELFSGTVIRLAKELNVPVPVNEMLYDKIAEIEAEY